MGNSNSTALQEDDIKTIEKETGFNSKQIQRLWNRFVDLDKKQKGHLTRDDFLVIPELAINPLSDRIIHAFFQKTEEVSFRDFIGVLAHFRPQGKKNDEKLNSREAKLQFAFRMYDLDDDGKVCKEELLAVLTMMVGDEDDINPVQLRSIAERTMLEADQDKDNRISFDEFCQVLSGTDVEQKMSIRFLS